MLGRQPRYPSQCDEIGHDHHKVRREVVRLQSVEVKEVPEECTDGEAEFALEMRDEDHALAGARLRHGFGAGFTPLDASWHLAGLNQSLDLAGVNRGSLPAATASGGLLLGGSDGVLQEGGAKNRG